MTTSRCFDCAVLFFPLWLLQVFLVWLFYLSVLKLRKSPRIFSHLFRLNLLSETVTSSFPTSFLSLFTSCFIENSLVLSFLILPCSCLWFCLAPALSSSSSAPSSAPSQIHVCLLSSFHVTAAIFSPYLEPGILSLLMILRRTPGRFLPEYAWSPITAPPPSSQHPLTSSPSKIFLKKMWVLNLWHWHDKA